MTQISLKSETKFNLWDNSFLAEFEFLRGLILLSYNILSISNNKVAQFHFRYSCSWPAYFEYYRRPTSVPDYDVLVKTCNLWRNYVDIEDSYESVLFIADYFANNSARLIPYAGPGHWNDPDTLLHGNFGLSYEQSKAQLAIWAIIAAPFLLSTDLRTIKPEIKELILNPEIIAVDQDPLGIQGKRLSSVDQLETWIRPVTPVVNNMYSHAVAFVSRRTDGHGYPFQFTLEELELTNKFGYTVKDLFNLKRQAFRILPGEIFEDRVNPTGANFYKFIPNINQAFSRCKSSILL